MLRSVAAALALAVLGAVAAAPAATAQQSGADAATRTVACTTPDPTAPKRQLRAVWIASVANIDWPSRPGLTPAEQQAEFLGWLDDAQRRKLNAVVVQVRPTADAFWPSSVEPWSHWITGTQGQDPGYDPLAFAVRAAHERNLEFHAWFNPYRVSQQADPNQLIPTHPARVHPDWVLPYGGKLYYNPGIPAVRAHVEDAIMDAVSRYDVDAVHFDDYFYPYPVAGQEFQDEATYQQYGAARFPVKADWRRDNTNTLVQELDQRIHAAKPWVKFGVSPFAVWRNKAADPEGSDTTAGAQTYSDLYADTRHWVRQQWLDYIAPQVYWNIGFAPADYAKLVPWWSDQVAGTDVQLFIGEATYKAGTSTQAPQWNDPGEISGHLTFDRAYPQVLGNIYFSAKDVRANRLGHVDVLVADQYQHPALVPARHPGDRGPWPTVVTSARRTADGVRLDWLDNRATSYAVYRFDGTVLVRPCNLVDARHLLGSVRATAFTDRTAQTGQHYTYVVTALDRLYDESLPSLPRFVR